MYTLYLVVSQLKILSAPTFCFSYVIIVYHLLVRLTMETHDDKVKHRINLAVEEKNTADVSSHHTTPNTLLQESNRFHCDICEKSFANKYRLDNHYVVHNNSRPFVCPICKTAFKRKPELHIHVMRRHLEENGEKGKRFLCEKCDKKFSTKSSRDIHIQFTHSTLKPLICECGQKLKRQMYLDKHKNTVRHKLALKKKGCLDARNAACQD